VEHISTSAETNATEVAMLYGEIAPAVYKFALVSTHNRADAEDVVQEVFLRVLKNWGRFRGDAHVKTWIFQIAHNYLVDIEKKKSKDAKLVFEVSREPSCDRIESGLEVEDILNDLSHNQRKVVDLRIIQDLSVADTAHLLQCSEGKVRTDTHRALKTLRKVAR
jgi:RNA polymerase sigma-70 factor (ECF subfamily)